MKKAVFSGFGTACVSAVRWGSLSFKIAWSIAALKE